MVEQVTSLGEGQITVSFQWDSGDPSVGIPSGWGEDTGAEVAIGPFKTFILFDVEPAKPVKDWRLDEVQCCYETEPNERGFRPLSFRPLIILADELGGLIPQERTLESLPAVCEAVGKAWARVQAIDELENLGEQLYGLKEEIFAMDQFRRDGLTLVNTTGWRETIPEETIEHRLQELEGQLEKVKDERDRLQAEYTERYREEAREDAGQPAG